MMKTDNVDAETKILREILTIQPTANRQLSIRFIYFNFKDISSPETKTAQDSQIFFMDKKRDCFKYKLTGCKNFCIGRNVRQIDVESYRRVQLDTGCGLRHVWIWETINYQS